MTYASVTDDLVKLNNDILIKLTQSAEAIHWIWSSIDNEELLRTIFIENKCHIISCICEEHLPSLLLDYLQEQCDLKILNLNTLPTDEYRYVIIQFQEVVKRHKKLEVVSVISKIYDNDFLQCLSGLLYRPCFQELPVKEYYTTTIFEGVLRSAFFRSPYPVTLRLKWIGAGLTLDSTVPVPLNTEQQSKSLDLKLEFVGKWYYLGPWSTFLPQCIVLKSLRIRNEGALFLLSKVKSIKADEITIDIDSYTDTNRLRSLLSRVLTNDMKIVASVCWHNLHRSAHS